MQQPGGTVTSMTTSNAFLFTGLLVGFSIAVPIGPMGLLCIQRTLHSGMRVGVCTGLGAATVNVIYGLVVILGFGTLAQFMPVGGRVLSFAGGLFLLWSAVRILMRGCQPGVRSSVAAFSPAAAYGSAVAFNLTNPMGPVLIIALLSPALAAQRPSWVGASALLLGMFMAAASWWVCLSGAVSLLRTRLSSGMLATVNQVAGGVLTIYGALALARSAGL